MSATQSLFGAVDHAVARHLDQLEQWPGGLYRRVIDMTAKRRVSLVRMADDFHEFDVELEHDGAHISNVNVDMRRLPWSVCSGAAIELQKLTAKPIDDAADWLSISDRRQQCNHLLDLAQLAANAAVRHDGSDDGLRRRYKVDIGRDEHGVRHLRLVRNEVLQHCLRLRLDGMISDIIENESPVQGLSLSKLPKELIASMSQDEQESYFILRRAAHVSLGRWFKYVSGMSPAEMGVGATCFTFQPDRAAVAYFDPTSVRDFTDHAHEFTQRAKPNAEGKTGS